MFVYNPHNFYMDVMGYSEIFDGIGDEITYAMDELGEKDVQKALCDYIIDNDYNPEICDFIKSVKWLGECRDFQIFDKKYNYVGDFHSFEGDAVEKIKIVIKERNMTRRLAGLGLLKSGFCKAVYDPRMKAIEFEWRA